mmetsp:Transcript_7928/g.16198  ORF Transcript_7928/g.16198 Transcript_7928/m.16198 type:complete len:418 (-) Transcript_7928:358-1611(-)
MGVARVPDMPGAKDRPCAKRLVAGSVLKGLTPGKPGMDCRTWSQLAHLATTSPDIKWLGKQVDANGEVQDFGWIHGPDWKIGVMMGLNCDTDMSIKGHRLRFGEKVLMYGGIDMVLRMVSLYPPGEEIGYHGIEHMFRCLMTSRGKHAVSLFMKHMPRTAYFLEPDNWNMWIRPHLRGTAEALTRQKVANSLLVKMAMELTIANVQTSDFVSYGVGGLGDDQVCCINRYFTDEEEHEHHSPCCAHFSDVKRCVAFCQEQLGAVFTASSSQLARGIGDTCDAWTEVLDNSQIYCNSYTETLVCQLRAFNCIVQCSGHVCREPKAHQAGKAQARLLARSIEEVKRQREQQRVWGVGSSHEAWGHEPCFEMVKRAVARGFFDDAGAAELQRAFESDIGKAPLAPDIAAPPLTEAGLSVAT